MTVHGVVPDIEEVIIEQASEVAAALLSTGLVSPNRPPIIRSLNKGGSFEVGKQNLLKIYGTYFTPATIIRMNDEVISPLIFIDDNQVRARWTPSVAGTYKLSVETHVKVEKSTNYTVSGSINAVADSLTTSLSAYNAASVGDWVEVTNSELTAVVSAVSGVYRVGTTNAQFGEYSGGSTSTATWANDTGSPMPSDGYVFAFRKVSGATVTNCVGAKVLLGPNASGPFIQLGSDLPSHATNTEGVQNFVLKGPPQYGSSDGAMAYYTSNDSVTYDYDAAYDAYFETYNLDLTPGNYGHYLAKYQGFATKVKQW